MRKQKNYDNINVTKRVADALRILKETTWSEPMTPKRFAELMWPDSTMHTSSKNTGNGACRGKAAWLCGGSYLRKLEISGMVRCSLDGNHTSTVYYISQRGLIELEIYEEQNG